MVFCAGSHICSLKCSVVVISPLQQREISVRITHEEADPGKSLQLPGPVWKTSSSTRIPVESRGQRNASATSSPTSCPLHEGQGTQVCFHKQDVFRAQAFPQRREISGVTETLASSQCWPF